MFGMAIIIVKKCFCIQPKNIFLLKYSVGLCVFEKTILKRIRSLNTFKKYNTLHANWLQVISLDSTPNT